MRLRLDKLVLSAGLALAMVATTIPVGAATETQYETPGFSVNGKTVDITSNDETFGAAYEVESTLTAGDWTGTKKSVVAKITGPSVSNPELTAALNNKTSNISLDLKNNNLTSGAVTAFGEKPVTISTTYDFSINKQYQWKAESATDMTETDIQAALDAKYVALTKDTLQTALGTGYSVDVVTNSAVNVTKTNVVAGKAPTDDDTKGTIASCTATVVGSFTAVVQTSSDKLADGYAYDIVQEKSANTSYVIYEFDPKTGAFSQVTTSDVKTTGDKDAIKYSLTDLTKVYMVASKPESTSSALLFGDDADEADNTRQSLTVSDTLTVTLRAAEGVTEAQKKTFTDLATASGLKVGAYFDATLVGNDTGNAGKLVEINIVKPSDIEALAGEGKTIKYTVLMQHAGMDPVALETTTGSKYITFSSQYFSTFALAYEIVDAETPAETPAEDPTSEAPANENDTQAAAPTTEAAQGSGTTSATGVKAGDNSMMPLFMTTLLLALCAGSLAIYKEKKTN